MRTLFVLLLAITPLVAAVPPEAVAAKAVLQKHCYRCHGEKGAAEGGMNFILDHAKLQAKNVVIVKNAEKSPLYARTLSGEMPADGKTKPTADEIAALKTWIANGAAPFDEPVAAAEVMTQEDLAALILKDIDRNPVFQHRKFLRYFSLAHFRSAGRPEEEIQTYRNGLAKLVNSLSWGRHVVPLVAVNADRTVFRIDLRDLQWTNMTWNQLALAHPFGFDPKTDKEKRLAALTGARVSYLRGDWFVAAASRPPLYHEILQIPTTLTALETQLGITSAARNIANSMVTRAGFNGSGVSKNNRLIERHDSSFGAYWKSYDFATNSGKQNLFDRPLGPGADDRRFSHDGGEIIFTLPNGLQAYMLVDAAGKRIDKGPTAIVSDSNRPDRAVENGISCMGCHAQGIIRKDDQILPHVLKNIGAYPKAESTAVTQLYRGSAALKKLFDEDQARFKKAVEQCDVPLTKSEPIITTVKRFEDELDLPLLLGEAMVSEETFRATLKDHPDLARSLGGVLVKGGTIQRETFVNAVPLLQTKLGRLPYIAGASQHNSPLPYGISDFGMFFSSAALVNGGIAINDIKKKTGRDVFILTQPNISDRQFALYDQADDEGRSKFMIDNLQRIKTATKVNGATLLLLSERGLTRWAVGSSGEVKIKIVDELLAEVLKPFKDDDYDGGLEKFIARAAVLMTKDAEASAPK